MCAPNTRTAAAIVTAVLALTLHPDAAVTGQRPRAEALDLHGKLYRSVFYTGTGTLAPEDIEAVPEPARARLSRYLARRAAFRSTYEHKAASFEDAARDARKRDVERGIVALVELPEIGALAADYVRDAEIETAWKGASKGPLDEAAYAESFLEAHPDTPLAPYLHLFIAQRERAAFEFLDREKNAEGARTAAAKYRAALRRAIASSDPIFSLVADDLDRRPYLFIDTGKHPREVAVIPDERQAP